MMTTTSHPFASSRLNRESGLGGTGCLARLRVFFVALVLLVLLPVPPAAMAQDAESFKSHYEKAVALYNTSQYERAIEEFRIAYEMRPAPIILFNLAQAQRKSNHPKEALEMYQRYLAGNPPDELKEETQKYIAEVKVTLAAAESEAKAAQEKAEAEKVAAAKAAQEKAAAERDAAARADEIRRRMAPTRPLNIAKWSLAGAGVLMTIAGAVMLGLDGRPACDLATGQKLCPEELNTKLGGGILLGAGLLSLGGSGVLFGLDYKRTHDGALRAQVALGMRF